VHVHVQRRSKRGCGGLLLLLAPLRATVPPTSRPPDPRPARRTLGWSRSASARRRTWHFSVSLTATARRAGRCRTTSARQCRGCWRAAPSARSARQAARGGVLKCTHASVLCPAGLSRRHSHRGVRRFAPPDFDHHAHLRQHSPLNATSHPTHAHACSRPPSSPACPRPLWRPTAACGGWRRWTATSAAARASRRW
jgi:hypothetical protein